MSFFISIFTLSIFIFFTLSMGKTHYELEWEYIDQIEKKLDLCNCRDETSLVAHTPNPNPKPVLKELDFTKYADVPTDELEETITRDMEELDKENAEIIRTTAATPPLKEENVKRGGVNPAPKKPKPNNPPPPIKRPSSHPEIRPRMIIGNELYDLLNKAGFNTNELISEESAMLAIEKMSAIEASDNSKKAKTKTSPKRRKDRPMPDMPGPKTVID
jgi:hypothetical protein